MADGVRRWHGRTYEQWLRFLKVQYGGVQELAAELETDSKNISSLMGPNTKRSAGNRNGFA